MSAVTAQQAADRLLDAWEAYLADTPGAYRRRMPGAMLGVSGGASPTQNAVLVAGPSWDEDAVIGALEELKATGLPYSLSCRAEMSPEFVELTRRYAMTESVEQPLMVADAESLRPATTDDLVVRAVGSDQVEVYLELLVAVFGPPIEAWRKSTNAATFDRDDVNCYVGEVAGEPVATALAAHVGDSLGIFNVATLAEYRNRGYGKAITTHAVQAGLRDGAQWAWLQSSSAGYPAYQKLGFTTIEYWRCSYTPTASEG
jgi:N-acetylglutamate synthase